MSSAFGALLKVAAGFESPMHTHSNDEKVVQLSGTSIHWTEDERPVDAPKMSRGDYLLMSAGIKHVSATQESESLEFITMNGPFAFSLAGEPDDKENQ